MQYQIDAIPANELFRHLSEDSLIEVDSNDERSLYMFACGCVALRRISLKSCEVRWCTRHRYRSPS